MRAIIIIFMSFILLIALREIFNYGKMEGYDAGEARKMADSRNEEMNIGLLRQIKDASETGHYTLQYCQPLDSAARQGLIRRGFRIEPAKIPGAADSCHLIRWSRP